MGRDKPQKAMGFFWARERSVRPTRSPPAGRRVGVSHAVRARAEIAKRKRGGGTGRVENGVEEEGVKRISNRAMPPQKRKVRARVSKRAP